MMGRKRPVSYTHLDVYKRQPRDICANVSLAFGLIKKGIVFAVQPPIDPGYHGAIVALMHNMLSLIHI